MISTIKVMNIKVLNSSLSTTFYFGHFFIWQIISKHCSQIHIWLIVSWNIRDTCWFVTMFTNTLSNEETTKIKVVDLDELYNFGIHHFFSWNHLMVENLVRTCHFFKFENLKCSNFVKRKEWPNQHSNLVGHDFRKF